MKNMSPDGIVSSVCILSTDYFQSSNDVQGGGDEGRTAREP